MQLWLPEEELHEIWDFQYPRMDREGPYAFSALTEELLITDGFWGKESQFLSLCVTPDRSIMLKWMATYPGEYVSHKLDSTGY